MIIPCESCNAVFRLESSTLNPTGSRVRCSKCGEIFKAYPPDYVNRRKHKRLKTRNLIYHVFYDKAGRLTFQGLSKALDINRKGILLETPEPFDSGLVSMMATDVDNHLIEIDGNVVYCKESPNGMYRSGIAFVGEDEQVATFVTELIKQYNLKKKEICFLIKHNKCATQKSHHPILPHQSQ